MSRSDHEDDWIGEVQHREGFVLDEMDAYALIAAEELFFNVQLHRLAMKSTIRVDFNLRSGDELKFLGLTDSIRKECRSIDKDMIGLPELSLELPRLPETLRDILTLSQKESTKKLAGDLYKTINAVC
ncbi:Isoflavone reductase [Phytophthora nicotianae]|uniref:Isoflavone reductase n=1 Tax=Phytophthora nicotianae TaxID=4792 RepID=A0A0W8CYN0_PHYNI|nr:Isoflavone reductase [Phytophthora nicotianae]